MKRAAMVLAFTAAVFLFLAGSTFRLIPDSAKLPAVPAAAAPALSVKVSVAPTPPSQFELLRRKASTRYTGTVAVSDTAPDGAFGVASVQVEPGQSGSITRRVGELEVTFVVGVDARRTRAATEVTIARNGVVLQRQNSDVMLSEAPPRGIVPLE